MDAFAVAIATGIVLGTFPPRQTFRLAWHFGLFQFLMPVVGWMAGLSVERFLSAYDHWLAFGLLAVIGGKMIYEATTREGREEAGRDPTRGVSLVALSVGLSLGVLRVGIWYPAVVIGMVACSLTAAGLHLGRRIGETAGRRMEVVGGAILVGIGVKILFGHLFG